MATRLYPHRGLNVGTGTFPTTEQDSETATMSLSLGLQTLSEGIGTYGALTPEYRSASTGANTSLQKAFIGFWSTAPLSADQTIGGAGETISINVADNESDLNANFRVNRAHVYVWRPSTGALVGDCCTVATTITGSPAEPTATAQYQVTEFSVDLSAVSALTGDVVIVELWSFFTQSNGFSRNVRVMLDGTVESTGENTVVTDHAAFFEFSQTLTFTNPETQLSHQSAVIFNTATVTPVAAVYNQSGAVFATSTSNPAVAAVSNQSMVVWYLGQTSSEAIISSLRAEVLTTEDDYTKRPRTFVVT